MSESRIGVIPGNPDGHALRLEGDALALRSPEQTQELLERLDRVREPWIRIRDMNAIWGLSAKTLFLALGFRPQPYMRQI